MMEPAMNTAFLAKTALFKNIPPQEIELRMHCLGGVVRSFPKGSYIHYACLLYTSPSPRDA